MSIAVLTQVYTEARRLAIAGSVVARGDFRLKKLLPPLEQAGKQAPVFAKLAEAATAVVEGPEESSAAALLELTSLVNAVLYTQGETGLAGPLEPVETSDFGGAAPQTSARVLKPLLEALSSTGSGRLELVKDAHTRGHFRDLRLVRPALVALDDPYPEIADLIAEKVLPIYGKAVLPELRAKFDPKGTKGHPRRLKLMHALDPSGARSLIEAALDDGSKEVKVAAISCLGANPADLPFLVEQSAAKAQDVRAAAYRALAHLDHPEAVAVLAKGLAGKDYASAANAISHATNPQFVNLLVAEIRSAVDALPKIKEKKLVSPAIGRINHLLRSFPKGNHPAADQLLLDLFARRGELAPIKGDTLSGSDIGETLMQVMEDGSEPLQSALVAAHASLAPAELQYSFAAGRNFLTSEKLYETFSPYLTADADKKKAKEAWAKREAIIGSIAKEYGFYYWNDDDDDERAKLPPYDPRWLDRAVEIGQLNLVHSLARPGHEAAQAFAKQAFDAALKKAKSPDDARNELITLIRLKHPEATDAFLAALAKRNKKAHFYHYWYTMLIPRLPKDAIPRLEELVSTMPENEANYWLDAIQDLRTK